MKHFIFVPLFMSLTLLSVAFGQKNIIKLDDGAYSNVLIAIDKDVEETDTIIENIKTMFTAASERLYLASRRHVYWKHITILVPTTWSRASQYGVATTESYELANIFVHDHTDDEPFVDNFAGCGAEGFVMHMTPQYIKDETYREDTFGSTDKVLVRNWGYLRWGLFKEHYDGTYGSAGYDAVGGVEEGTRCSLKIEGDLVLPNGTPCQKDPNSARYEDDCRFAPHESGQTATGSLLFGTRDSHVQSIEDFCDDDPPNPGSLHNPAAPNLMNIRCGGDSAWKVMRERTRDFVNGPRVISNTTPEFNIIQVSALRSVVLILDISGSMTGARFDKMIRACTHYIRNTVPDDSQLGIVEFSSSATRMASLSLIENDSDRDALISVLPPTASGGTCIGCGIDLGIDVLGAFAQGGYILLLSDGQEGSYSPNIRDMHDKIIESGVIMDTLALGAQADQQMEDLSEMTSGIPDFCHDSDSGSCMIQALENTVTSRPSVGSNTVPVQIYTSDVVVPSDPGFQVVPVIIDAALGNDTVVTVTWTASSLVSVVVTGPDGTRVNQTDPRYQVDTTTKIITIRLPTAQPGPWDVTIYNDEHTTEYASVAVSSKPSSDDYKPVSVQVFLGSREVDYAQTPALAIYAQVQQDYQPVGGADITALVTNSGSSTTALQLLDNGSGSDLLNGDGIYSAFFLNFTMNGRYNVKVDVIGYDDVVQTFNRGTRSIEVEPTSSSSTPSLMRTASGGVFEVQSYTPNAPDALPPSRIQDLTYTSFSYENSTVTLTWTAVGDDLDQGTAFDYELRYATNFSMIRYDFNSSHRVTPDQVVKGNLSDIAAAGVIETIVIELPERGEDIVYYFAIRAFDEAGNAGDLSNIASLSIRVIPLLVTSSVAPTEEEEPDPTGSEPDPTESEPDPTRSEPDPTKCEPDNKAAIIGLSCALGVAVVGWAVTSTAFYCYAKQKKEQPSSVQHMEQELAAVQVVLQPKNAANTNPLFS